MAYITEKQREDAECALNDCNEALTLIGRIMECTDSSVIRELRNGGFDDIIRDLKEERDGHSDIILQAEEQDEEELNREYLQEIM